MIRKSVTAKYSDSLIKVVSYAGLLALAKAMTFGTQFVLAWHLEDKEFGYVTLANASFLLAVVLFGLNHQSAIVRYFHSDGFFPVWRGLKPVLGGLLAGSLLSSMAVFLAAATFGVPESFALLPFCGFLGATLLAFSALFRCEDSLAGFSCAQLMRPLLLAIFLLVFLLHDVVPNAADAYISALLGALVLSWMACGWYALKSSLNPPYETGAVPTGRLLAYMMPLFVAQLAALANNVGDRYLLAWFLQTADVGRYGKMYVYASTLGFAFEALTILWAPYVMKNVSGIYQRYFGSLLFIAGGAIALSALVLGFGIYVFRHGSPFGVFEGELLSVFLIVVSAFIARAVYQVFTPLITATDRTRWVAALGISGALIGLLLNIVLIPTFGIVGAALATYVSFLYFGGSTVYLTVRLRRRDLLSSSG